MTYFGVGVMIQQLGGNKESVEAWKASVGKKIERLWIISEDKSVGVCDPSGSELRVQFDDKSAMALVDTGQS